MVEGGTAAALVDAAEEGFAQDGFQGASLRAVMRTAGADPGAVHYHFRDREGLAAAVLERILAPLNDRRLELLATTELRARERAATGRRSGSVPVAQLIDAIVRPDLEAASDLHERGSGRGRLIGAMYVHPVAFVKAQVESQFSPVAARFMPHLITAVPNVGAEILAWRIRWCVFGTVGALLSDDREPFEVGLDELIERIIPPMAAAVAAPDRNRKST